MTTILGVDPGIRGGLAIITVDDGAAPRLVDAIDIPVTGTGAKERVDAIALRDWIVTHKPQHTYIERGQAMPKQGASSGFKYGRAVGAIEAVLACCEIPMTVIERSASKKLHRLRGKDKEGGRQRLATVSCPTRAACAETLAWARRARADCIIRGAAVISLGR